MTAIDWGLTWNMVLAISTASMALAIIVTAIFAVVQLGHIKKARNSSLLIQLHQIWESKECVQARRMINQYSNGLSLEEAASKIAESLRHFDDVNAEEYFIIVRLANFFEHIGFLTCEGHLERKQTLELFFPAAKRYWKLLFDFVNYQRKERTESQSDAWTNFEYLALGCPRKNKCLRIFRRHINKKSVK